MINISLRDDCFSHAYSCGNGDLKILSKYINWDRDNIHNICFHTDNYISRHVEKNNSINVAWIIEPKSISEHLYNIKFTDWNKFDYVLSHNKEFINLLYNSCGVQSYWYAFGGCWIYEEDRKVYDKTKNLSVICSDKRTTVGHKLRHKIINMYKSHFSDISGRGYNTIHYKLQSLREYRFSLVIENDNTDDFFSEKIIDCFVTGTIPIYWGTKNIEKYFDLNGLIKIENEEDFANVIPLLTEEYYYSKLESINKNFYLSQNYVNMEDWIYLNYKNKIFDCIHK